MIIHLADVTMYEGFSVSYPKSSFSIPLVLLSNDTVLETVPKRWTSRPNFVTHFKKHTSFMQLRDNGEAIYMPNHPSEYNAYGLALTEVLGRKLFLGNGTYRWSDGDPNATEVLTVTRGPFTVSIERYQTFIENPHLTRYSYIYYEKELVGDKTINKRLSAYSDSIWTEQRRAVARESATVSTTTASEIISIPRSTIMPELAMPAKSRHVPSELKKFLGATNDIIREYMPELAAKAYENVDYSTSNNFINLKELAELPKQVLSTAKSVDSLVDKFKLLFAKKNDLRNLNRLLDGATKADLKYEYFRNLNTLRNSLNNSSLRDADDIIKSFANLYLSYDYGYKLTVRDFVDATDDTLQYIEDQGNALTANISRCTARKGISTTIGNCRAIFNCYYVPFGQVGNKILRLAEYLDIIPDFSTFWDSVPYSFVADWFVNLGSFIEAIDNQITFATQHDIRGVEEIIEIDLLPSAGTQTFLAGAGGQTLYRRIATKKPPIALMKLQFGIPTSAKQLANGGVLIVQRLTSGVK